MGELVNENRVKVSMGQEQRENPLAFDLTDPKVYYVHRYSRFCEVDLYEHFSEMSVCSAGGF
jgi:hypothetical protein